LLRILFWSRLPGGVITSGPGLFAGQLERKASAVPEIPGPGPGTPESDSAAMGRRILQCIRHGDLFEFEGWSSGGRESCQCRPGGAAPGQASESSHADRHSLAPWQTPFDQDRSITVRTASAPGPARPPGRGTGGGDPDAALLADGIMV
jgi:hypothetical protein